MTSKHPIVVTGMPRAGTSWVGKILEASGQVVYVNEPMNPRHPPGHSPGVLNASVAHRYEYICAENEAQWLQPFRDTTALRYHFLAEIRANHRPYDVARMLKYGSAFTIGRLKGRRAMLNDPFALMSVPWLVERLGCTAIVLVRDPVALVGSWRALGYQADLDDLLDQPALMRDYLEPYADDLQRMEGSDDGIGRICTLWRALYGAVSQMRESAEVVVFRYEDLVRSPHEQFRQMYADCEVPWAKRSQQLLDASTRDGGGRGGHSFKGLSKTAYRAMGATTALGSYRSRLTEAEIERVNVETADIRELFYPEPGVC